MVFSDSELAAAVERAYARIRGEIVRTPLTFSPSFSRDLGGRAFVKWDNRQTTGSFKFRGALAKVRSLPMADRRAGLISASTGNHGLGLARACHLEGLDLLLYLPRTTASDKIAKLRAAGAKMRFRGRSCDRTEILARRDGRRTGRVFVSPYNDPEVIAGQGTIGLEILADLPEVDDVVVPVGGGGLVAGIGGYLKARAPGVRILGVEPAASAFMKASLRAGRLVAVREGRTLADAVAGGIEPRSMTFELCRRFVDRMLTVGERRLRSTVKRLFDDHGEIVEAAGALSAAAGLKYARLFRGRTVVLVAGGGNIAASVHRRLAGGRRLTGPGNRPMMSSARRRP
ncbi:MAG: pyridoxal-phosphate dependent enzyme [Candidatus Aminicenantes bacterium]|nr:pyridoxal-phosphate dependent enzyme [Candidatus Aminicenantes bacterium]